jgi:hypothetical protein
MVVQTNLPKMIIRLGGKDFPFMAVTGFFLA